MTTAIKKLEPVAVWKNFSDLNAVPRPSKKEERVIAFMMKFGQGLGLPTFKDEVGNVIIRKPATQGMEARKTVTLQSHLDMVHQKNSATEFDFDTQGIEMQSDGEWVKAIGTTLGADNGMGVAAIMALLESSDIPHPALEALFTIDEETGMTGAQGLKGGVLQGEILLNLDTEEDDEIDIGCAGGIDVSAERAYIHTPTPGDALAYRVVVKGLQGGHSGMDIHKGFGNANKLMNRLLFRAMEEVDMDIAEIHGGGLRNAIPRESTALVVVKEDMKWRFEKVIQESISEISGEFSQTEPGLKISLKLAQIPEQIMDKEARNALLKVLYSLHNGVYRMSTAIPDLVETSNNVAKVTVENGHVYVNCLTRSSVESSKMDLANALKAVFELGGFSVEFSGSYPGWQPNPDSEILKVLEGIYERLFDQKPKVVACHAGLECGILGRHYPEMDMISFGPTIKGAHSPDERVNIASVQKFWIFLKEILLHAPAKS